MKPLNLDSQERVKSQGRGAAGDQTVGQEQLRDQPPQSERSRLHVNQSQIQFLGTGQQPSETSTNNLLMYSQSIKLDAESTIHNIGNQSMMQSEFDPRGLLVDKAAASAAMLMHMEESEKLLRKHRDLERDAELMRKIRGMQTSSNYPMTQGGSANFNEEQMRAMLTKGPPPSGPGDVMNMLHGVMPMSTQQLAADESINFSNLDSSINPSAYNESQSHRQTDKKMNEHQFHLFYQQQQQLAKAAMEQQQALSQSTKKLKTNFQTAQEKETSVVPAVAPRRASAGKVLCSADNEYKAGTRSAQAKIVAQKPKDSGTPKAPRLEKNRSATDVKRTMTDEAQVGVAAAALQQSKDKRPNVVANASASDLMGNTKADISPTIVKEPPKLESAASPSRKQKAMVTQEVVVPETPVPKKVEALRGADANGLMTAAPGDLLESAVAQSEAAPNKRGKSPSKKKNEKDGDASSYIKQHVTPLALPTHSMQQLSDTEMTSFLTPTATEKFEQEFGVQAASLAGFIPNARAKEPLRDPLQQDKSKKKKAPKQTTVPTPPADLDTEKLVPPVEPKATVQSTTATTNIMGFHKYSQITKSNVEKKDKAAAATSIQQQVAADKKKSGQSTALKEKERFGAATGSGSGTAQTPTPTVPNEPELVHEAVDESPMEDHRSPSEPLRSPTSKARVATLSPIEVASPKPEPQENLAANNVDQKASRGRYVQRGGVDSEDERLYEELGAIRPDDSKNKTAKRERSRERQNVSKNKSSLSPQNPRELIVKKKSGSGLQPKSTQQLSEVATSKSKVVAKSGSNGTEHLKVEKKSDQTTEPSKDVTDDMLKQQEANQRRPYSQGNLAAFSRQRGRQRNDAQRAQQAADEMQDNSAVNQQEGSSNLIGKLSAAPVQINTHINHFNQFIITAGPVMDTGKLPQTAVENLAATGPPSQGGGGGRQRAMSKGLQVQAGMHQGPGSVILYEDQSSYFNGLSGYDAFEARGGGPVSDMNGYPMSVVAAGGHKPRQPAGDGTEAMDANVRRTMRNNEYHELIYNIEADDGINGTDGFHYFQGDGDLDNFDDVDGFIQNDDGSQSANLMMLDGDFNVHAKSSNKQKQVGQHLTAQGPSHRTSGLGFEPSKTMKGAAGKRAEVPAAMQASINDRLLMRGSTEAEDFKNFVGPSAVTRAQEGRDIRSKEYIVGARQDSSKTKNNNFMMELKVAHQYSNMTGKGASNGDNRGSLAESNVARLVGHEKTFGSHYRVAEPHSAALLCSPGHNFRAGSEAGAGRAAFGIRRLADLASVSNSNDQHVAVLQEMQKAEGQITGSPDSLMHPRGDMGVGNALFGQGILAMQNSLKSLSKDNLLQNMRQGQQYAQMHDSALLDKTRGDKLNLTKEAQVSAVLLSMHSASYQERLNAFKKLHKEYQQLKNKTKKRIALFLEESVSKSDKYEEQRKRLPVTVLVRIVQHLLPNETFRFLGTCRYVRDMITKRPEFDGQWVIKSFQNLLSKSGYLGLRNNNLRRIDIQLRAMHFQSESIRRDAYDEQWATFENWWAWAIFLLFLATPILLIVNEEQSILVDGKIQSWVDLRIILAPATLAWLSLFIAQCVIRSQASKYYQRVTSLMETNQNFKTNRILPKMGNPKGRLAQHCTRYELSDFNVRFLNILIYAALCFYLGVVLKVYLFDTVAKKYERGKPEPYTSDFMLKFEWIAGYVNWTVASAIAYVPVFLMYTIELIGEACKSQNNLSSKSQLLEKFVRFSTSKNLGGNSAGLRANTNDARVGSMIREHACRTLFLDVVGPLINLIFLPCGLYAFIFLTAQRVDGKNELSLYLLMLPMWITAIPCFIYTILVGLAAQNMRVSTGEKCALSFIVPLGFLATLILLVWYSEIFLRRPADKLYSNEEPPIKLLKWIFIPHFFSLMCLYLYLRCLVRPVRSQVHSVAGPGAGGQAQTNQSQS